MVSLKDNVGISRGRTRGDLSREAVLPTYCSGLGTLSICRGTLPIGPGSLPTSPGSLPTGPDTLSPPGPRGLFTVPGALYSCHGTHHYGPAAGPFHMFCSGPPSCPLGAPRHGGGTPVPSCKCDIVTPVVLPLSQSLTLSLALHQQYLVLHPPGPPMSAIPMDPHPI